MVNIFDLFVATFDLFQKFNFWKFGFAEENFFIWGHRSIFFCHVKEHLLRCWWQLVSDFYLKWFMRYDFFWKFQFCWPLTPFRCFNRFRLSPLPILLFDVSNESNVKLSIVKNCDWHRGYFYSLLLITSNKWLADMAVSYNARRSQWTKFRGSRSTGSRYIAFWKKWTCWLVVPSIPSILLMKI